jgi:hypothetical protein
MIINKFPAFCETRRLLLCSQEHATGTYPEQDDSSPQYHTLLL